ncbi:hypothetical protein HOY80DRAFT_1135377 [Tuber brumale]|nr:hypothetical protein HOY80DRAFT_1135377 [Tuber brumale]
MPVEEPLYTQVALQISHPEGVGAEGGGRGGGEDLRPYSSLHHLWTHPLNYVARPASSQIRLPQSVRDRTESAIVHVATSDLVDWAHKTLCGGWGEPGVKNVLDVGGGGAGVLAWRSVIAVEEEIRKDLLSERTGKPPPGPAGGALPAAGKEWIASCCCRREKVSKHLGDTLFIPRVRDIDFENLQDKPGAQTENKAQPRKPYDPTATTNKLLPRTKPLFRPQIIEQLWSHINPNGGGATSRMLARIFNPFFPGMPSSADPSIRGGPGAIIAACTNRGGCPVFVSGPADGTQRKYYCRLSLRYEHPGYLQRLVEESSKNHEDMEHSYVAFCRGVDHHSYTRNKISPTRGRF